MSKVIGILYNVYMCAAVLHKCKLMCTEKFEVSFVFLHINIKVFAFVVFLKNRECSHIF